MADVTDYAGASTICAEDLARLAVPRGRAIYDCLKTWTSGGRELWLGATDDDGDGVFLGADGLGTVPDDGGWWGTGEPNGRYFVPPERCAFLSSGGVSDAPCTYQAHPMCEINGQF